MKIWAMSDLHVDVNKTKPFTLANPRPDYDVLVIAGDIGEDTRKSINWIAAQAVGKPAIYVPGNHDFYGTAIDDNLEQALALIADFPNVHLLHNSHVDIDGVRFLGGTLWTDYCLYGEPYRWQCYSAAQSVMNDHRLIRVARRGYSKFRTKEAFHEHERTRDYIAAMLDLPFDGPRVVVTHHTPSMKSIDHDRFAGDLLNAAYASDLEHLAEKADLWLHGHIHATKDYMIGNCRIVCNPRGYVAMGEKCNFDPRKILEIAPQSHRQREDEQPEQAVEG